MASHTQWDDQRIALLINNEHVAAYWLERSPHLKAEFKTPERLLAYATAKAAGQVRIIGGTQV